MNEQTTLEPVETTTLDQTRVSEIANTIDLHNTQSILEFGFDAQKQLTEISDQMLLDVKSKDSGATGELLNKMIGVLRGFQGEETGLNKKPGFFARLFGKTQASFERFLSRFDTVSDQIDQISNHLEEQKQTLLVDVKSLDALYDANLDYYRELCHYIAAGESALEKSDTVVLPRLREEAEASDDIAAAQRLRDHQERRDELDRRLHDLRLTRQVAMQGLPSIRLLQENDKGLVNKINTTLINTVPLWRQQLAQAIAIHHAQDAADALKASSDLTNELLEKNATNLQQANRSSREQIERGVFDIESIERANQNLINTIEESISLHDQARNQRQEAVGRLDAAERALKDSLTKASQVSR
ncbi:toxic anion resistance protein [Suttonella sp. R2A3]|uniref:toxic anion resistance protein n=1 Tax=Suttonella sp. R2A3 TaxID=2908648 RepID=UPI001F43216D|nr:toxic anion resistance protein [Suttonella sp. R2A3]UJF24711.1 toxic anion resistance protein [Suttonella sp. R2A3]